MHLGCVLHVTNCTNVFTSHYSLMGVANPCQTPGDCHYYRENLTSEG